jgi:peroxiredoxin
MRRACRDSAALDRRRFLRGIAGLGLLFSPALKAQAADVFVRVANPPRAADFALDDIDGRTWRLSALGRKVVVVNFWATWCPPCRRELPSLQVLHRESAAQGVAVLGINAGETWDQIAAFTSDFKPAITFPLLIDKSGSVMRDWQVKALPTTYVVNRAGRIVLRALGGRDFSRRDALADIAALAKER